jgi:hypothetical protein
LSIRIYCTFDYYFRVALAAGCAQHQASVYQSQPLTHPAEFTNASHANKIATIQDKPREKKDPS